MIRVERFLAVLLLPLALVVFVSVPAHAESSWSQRMAKGMASAMTDLGVEVGSRKLSVVTNDPYVKQGTNSGISCLDSKGVACESEAIREAQLGRLKSL